MTNQINQSTNFSYFIIILLVPFFFIFIIFFNPKYFSINSRNRNLFIDTWLHYARLNAGQKSHSDVRKTQDWMECGLAGRNSETFAQSTKYGGTEGILTRCKNCSLPRDKRFRFRAGANFLRIERIHDSLIKLDF